MAFSNPVFEDHKMLLVYKSIGVKLLQQLKAELVDRPYSDHFKNSNMVNHMLTFSYLGLRFTTKLELFFYNGKMPAQAYIATYLLGDENQQPPAEIVSYSFDLKYKVNDIYTLEDFAEPYLIELHQNLKKHFSDEHKPFIIPQLDK